MAVRPGVASDLPALTAIYNHYVRTSHVTFDTDEFTVDARRDWFSHYSSDGPHRLLAFERAGQIAGYATSSPFRPKPGYRSTVETTVYVAPLAVGTGVGTALYEALLEAADSDGVHRCVAGIAVPNDASVALHERFGFRHLGTYTEVGSKFGRYVDVAWYERGPDGDWSVRRARFDQT